jgi:hypothetical protein
MSWLQKIVDEMLVNTPKPTVLTPSLIFGFDDVRTAIEMVEGAIDRKKTEVMEAGHAALAKAARNPDHSWVKNPVFGPFQAAMWESDIGFPMILRRSLLIAIYSHVEHILLRWCHWLHEQWSLKNDVGSIKRSKGESTPHFYLRYLRDVAGLDCGDFRQWPEWPSLDAYRLARNCLAHDGGIVDNAADGVKIGALPHVDIDSSGLLLNHPALIHVGPGACEAAAETSNAFFDRLTQIYVADKRALRP